VPPNVASWNSRSEKDPLGRARNRSQTKTTSKVFTIMSDRWTEAMPPCCTNQNSQNANREATLRP
jgi:hypothetical protein